MAVVEPRGPSECVCDTKCHDPADIVPKTSLPSHPKVIPPFLRELTGEDEFEIPAIEEDHESTCRVTVGAPGVKDDHSEAPPLDTAHSDMFTKKRTLEDPVDTH